MLRLRQSEYRVQKTLSISLAVNCCYLISTYGVLDSPRKVSDGPVQRICTHRGLLIYIICLHTMYVTCLPSIRHTYRSTCETFFFFFDPHSSLLREYTIIRGLSFQVSVGHISCTIWSSSRLSTNDFFFIGWITNHLMLLPWGPWCLGQLPLPLGGRGYTDTFGDLRLLQVKIIVLGQDI